VAAEILLIDDDRAFLKILSRVLESHGFSVLAATSGKAGLAETLGRKPALIILDLVMPGLSGLEVCQELKQKTETADIPILILTANDREGQDIACLDMGADAYLTKPYEPDELLRTINLLLGETARA